VLFEPDQNPNGLGFDDALILLFRGAGAAFFQFLLALRGIDLFLLVCLRVLLVLTGLLGTLLLCLLHLGGEIVLLLLVSLGIGRPLRRASIVLRITQRLVLLLAFEGFAAGLFVGGPLGQAGLVLRTPQGLIAIALGRR
jgi:hypothetical protein